MNWPNYIKNHPGQIRVPKIKSSELNGMTFSRPGYSTTLSSLLKQGLPLHGV